MNPLIGIAGNLLLSQFMGDVAPVRSKAKYIIVISILGSLLFIAGLAFLIYGTYLHLNVSYDPEIAALSMGGFLIVLTALLIICGIIVLRINRSRVKKVASNVVGDISGTIDEIVKEVGGPLSNHPKMSILIAGVVGVIVAKKLF